MAKLTQSETCLTMYNTNQALLDSHLGKCLKLHNPAISPDEKRDVALSPGRFAAAIYRNMASVTATRKPYSIDFVEDVKQQFILNNQKPRDVTAAVTRVLARMSQLKLTVSNTQARIYFNDSFPTTLISVIQERIQELIDRDDETKQRRERALERRIAARQSVAIEVEAIKAAKLAKKGPSFIHNIDYHFKLIERVLKANLAPHHKTNVATRRAALNALVKYTVEYYLSREFIPLNEETFKPILWDAIAHYKSAGFSITSRKSVFKDRLNACVINILANRPHIMPSVFYTTLEVDFSNAIKIN